MTGGAGFIGSHIATRYSHDGHEVVVLDDFSTGSRDNVGPDTATILEASVTDLDAVRKAVDGAELVFHLAASRAVQRSVDDPISTDRANTGGTLTVLTAAHDAGVRRVVLASSSSVYGGVAPVPTPEDAPLSPKSPYAVSKVAGELYARVFFELHGLETVSLRFFNVFGPRQRPDSAYAAVIPLFIRALSRGERPIVHGDGEQSRDFTFVSDVVEAAVLAADTPGIGGRIYNIGGGGETSLLELLAKLRELIGPDPDPGVEHAESRPGDVRRSRADFSAAARDLGYEPRVSLREGLAAAVEWVTRET